MTKMHQLIVINIFILTTSLLLLRFSDGMPIANQTSETVLRDNSTTSSVGPDKNRAFEKAHRAWLLKFIGKNDSPEFLNDSDDEGVNANLENSESAEILEEYRLLEEKMNSPEAELFEGDILGVDPDLDRTMLASQLHTAAASNLWPSGKIPYEISATINPAFAGKIRKAISIIQEKTCIRFELRTKQDKDYVYIAGAPQICSAYIGRSPNRNYIFYSTNGCSRQRQILHELMHAIGFYHEMARLDRDQYVEINRDNIQERAKKNFIPYRESDTQGFPFDLKSVTMYQDGDFAINNKIWTIRTKDGAHIPNDDTLSDLDIQSINKLYQCNGNPTALNQEQNEMNFDGRTFRIQKPATPLTFQDAQNACSNQNRKLAVLDNPESFFNDAGANFKEDIYWVGNQPTSSSLCASVVSGLLRDTKCDDQLNYICE